MAELNDLRDQQTARSPLEESLATFLETIDWEALVELRDHNGAPTQELRKAHRAAVQTFLRARADQITDSPFSEEPGDDQFLRDEAARLEPMTTPPADLREPLLKAEAEESPLWQAAFDALTALQDAADPETARAIKSLSMALTGVWQECPKLDEHAPHPQG